MSSSKKLIEQAEAELRRLKKDIFSIDLSNLCPYIEQIVRTSIEENFQQGGRFGTGRLGGGSKRWKKSMRAIRQGGQTLVDTGRLASAIVVKVNWTKSKGFIIRMGARTKYARIHQYGNPKQGLPPRPYLVLQDSDAEEILEMVGKEILKKLA